MTPGPDPLSPPSVPPEPVPNPLARIIGVLFSPGETFAGIARRPTWLAPLALLAVLGLVVSFVMNQRMDWREFFRARMDQNPRFEQMPAEQKERMLDLQARWASRVAYAAPLFPTLLALLLGLIYWGAFNALAGAQIRFSQSFGVTAHALSPGLVSSLLGIVVMYLKEPGAVEPDNLLATSLASFLDRDAEAWLRSLASSFELFWLWTMVLLVIGFAAVNPRKIRKGLALGIIGGIWLFWVLAKTGIAAAFS